MEEVTDEVVGSHVARQMRATRLPFPSRLARSHRTCINSTLVHEQYELVSYDASFSFPTSQSVEEMAKGQTSPSRHPYQFQR